MSADKELLTGWLAAKRTHIVDQVSAMAEADRRTSRLPSGWTPLGLVSHLTLDVERFWFRAVVGGEQVDLPDGYAGWLPDPSLSDEAVLEAYAAEARTVDALISETPLDAPLAWWPFGEAPYANLEEVLMHVIVETATHAGQLDVARELADGGQRLVMDAPED